MACGMYAGVFLLIFFAGRFFDFMWNRIIEPLGVKLGYMKPGQFDVDPSKVATITLRRAVPLHMAIVAVLTPRRTAPRRTAPHITSHHTTPHRTVPYRTAPHITPRRTATHPTPPHPTPNHSTPRRATGADREE